MNINKCDFVNTEINHDLGKGSGGPISINEHHKKSEFISASRASTGCDTPDPNHWTDWFRNDPNSFKSVVKMNGKDVDPGFLYSLPEDIGGIAPDADGYFPGTWTAKTENGEKSINVQKFPQNGPSSNNFSDKQIYHIFDNCSENSEGHVDAFFVIDTGDKLGKILSTGLTNTPYDKHFNVHVIHSTVTLGDSASKTKPNGPIYDKLFKKNFNGSTNSYKNPCTVHSWLCTNNVIIDNGADGDIPPTDFMTAYRIEANYLPGPPFTYQNWKMNGNTVYNTTNPKKENNKPTIQKWLSSGTSSIQPTPGAGLSHIQGNGTLTPDKKKEISINMQKKRSGDHLQILFAKYLYKYKSNLSFIKPEKLHEISVPGGTLPQYKSHQISQMTNPDIKKNTYFITGDWPACAFAIFNEVNTVMFYKTTDKRKTCFLIFTFS